MKILVLIGFLAFLPSLTVMATPCATAFNGEASQVKLPKIIVLSAPSGGGKTTLAQMLIKDFPNLTISVSTTTRAPRGAEKNGVDYHFLTKEEFKAKIAKGEFAEYAEVHGNFYGTDISNIQGQHAQGKSVLALLDINGANNLKKSFPGQVETIFISPPSMQVLEARLRGRGTDSEAAIQLRLANAKKEMEEAPKFDHQIINDQLAVAYKELAQLIKPLIP